MLLSSINPARACLLAMAVACGTAGAQQVQPPQPHPNAGAMVYYCKKDGLVTSSLQFCEPSAELVTTGRVEANGTITRDGPLPTPDLRPAAEREQQAAPAPAPPPAPPAKPAPEATPEPHKWGYINKPWLWIVGFGLVFGLAGRIMGRSFGRWGAVGVLVQFVLVGLDKMPLK